MPWFGDVFIPQERIDVQEMTDRETGRVYSRLLAVVVIVVGLFIFAARQVADSGVFNVPAKTTNCEAEL